MAGVLESGLPHHTSLSFCKQRSLPLHGVRLFMLQWLGLKGTVVCSKESKKIWGNGHTQVVGLQKRRLRAHLTDGCSTEDHQAIMVKTLMQKPRGSFSVFKLATANAQGHSLMEGPSTPQPLSLLELWINKRPKRGLMENKTPAFLLTKTILEIQATLGFLKLFPKIRLAFPLMC